jgi:hypothetical protein
LGNEATLGGGVCIAANDANYFKMSGGTIAGNKATSKGAAFLRYGLGAFEKTGGTIYGNVTDAGDNANKAAEGVTTTVHSIEIGNALVAYYDETAGDTVILKHSSVSGSVKTDNWSTPN